MNRPTHKSSHDIWYNQATSKWSFTCEWMTMRFNQKKKAFPINKKKFRKPSSDNFYFKMWIRNCCSLPFRWPNNVMTICRKTPNPIILHWLIKNQNQASLCTYKPTAALDSYSLILCGSKLQHLPPLSILIKDSSLYLKMKEVV